MEFSLTTALCKRVKKLILVLSPTQMIRSWKFFRTHPELVNKIARVQYK